jgi:hypothetical protein
VNRAALVCAVVLLFASVPPCQGQNRIAIRGFGDAGLTVFTATQSFKAILAAVEGQWALVPNAFGDSAASVARLFDEHDLGGFTLSVRIIVGQ